MLSRWLIFGVNYVLGLYRMDVDDVDVSKAYAARENLDAFFGPLKDGLHKFLGPLVQTRYQPQFCLPPFPRQFSRQCYMYTAYVSLWCFFCGTGLCMAQLTPSYPIPGYILILSSHLLLGLLSVFFLSGISTKLRMFPVISSVQYLIQNQVVW